MKLGLAATAYWGIVFALGFVLGAVRVTWLVPLVGLLPATAIELPLILGGSWLAARWLIGRFGIVRLTDALAMGALAFALLMAAECALAGALAGQTPTQWLADFREPHALLGLAGQMVFALMPWLIARQDVSAAGT